VTQVNISAVWIWPYVLIKYFIGPMNNLDAGMDSSLELL
jgi:hypothetical protein